MRYNKSSTVSLTTSSRTSSEGLALANPLPSAKPPKRSGTLKGRVIDWSGIRYLSRLEQPDGQYPPRPADEHIVAHDYLSRKLQERWPGSMPSDKPIERGVGLAARALSPRCPRP